MKLFQMDSWGVAARLVAIALVPAILMLIAVNVSLYLVAQDEVNNDIRERGRLVAAALAAAIQERKLNSGQLIGIVCTGGRTAG